ncbi:hypothetical protein TDB9533_01243 [Thalassocella blandensis]|nr:hypothetical protein TDB9533_01243 [Thalassocella blandensis]
MKAFFSIVISNLLSMFATRKFGMWAARLWSKQTKNLIDDNAVEFIDAAFENDMDRTLIAAERVVAELKKAIATRK